MCIHRRTVSKLLKLFVVAAAADAYIPVTLQKWTMNKCVQLELPSVNEKFFSFKLLIRLFVFINLFFIWFCLWHSIELVCRKKFWNLYMTDRHGKLREIFAKRVLTWAISNRKISEIKQKYVAVCARKQPAFLINYYKSTTIVTKHTKNATRT